jgi:squalene monooxygenase
VSDTRAFDVVIAGGGMAGAAVAAALDGLGLRTLVVEPGLDGTKRLAGELIHPPGTTDLAELGLLEALQAVGGAPVRGFAVLADGQAHLLPYAPVAGLRETGLAMEHGAIGTTLRDAIARRPHVTVWHGARVVALADGAGDTVGITVAGGGHEARLAARLLVGADGAASTIRRLAGIVALRRRISSMVGFVLPADCLPHPGFGSILVDGPAPALAYQISRDAARVMFDVPGDADGHGVSACSRAHLGALPEPLRTAVRDAMDAQRGLVSASYSVVPTAVARGRVALVGDAAGCCHPLTATGLSVCTRDAIRLRDALAAEPDVPAALRRYAARRAGPQRTRLALAEALYAVFVARTTETRVLRTALLRYWKRSPRGRAVSMALLSTQEGRMSIMAREYARVIRHALPGLLRRGSERRPLAARTRVAVSLSLTTLRYAGGALRGLVS